jgi:hypothetical protein
MHPGIKPSLPGSHIQPLDDPLGGEDLQIPVYGPQADMREALLDLLIDIGSVRVLVCLF